MALIWAAVSVILFVYFLKQLSVSTNKKKKLPPGPLGLPILGHFHLLGKNPHHDFHRLARKHGPIMYMRIGPVHHVIVSSPAAAELFCKTHDLIFADKPYNEAAMCIAYEQRGLVTGHYGPAWRNLRKLCTVELLSQLRVNQFHSMRRAEVGDLVNSLKQASEKHEIVDVSSRVSGLSADMVCLMVFGRKYEDKDLDDKGFKAVIMETMEVGAIFNLGDYFPYLRGLDLQGLTRRMKHLAKIFDGFLEKIIDDHVKNDNENNKTAEKKHGGDFVDILMAMLESGEADFEFDRRSVKAILFDMLVAGMDTSATAIEWTLSALMKHPKVMQKLKKELEAIVGLDHMVEESHLDRLEYLDCVIKETLRLLPATPFLLHESMEDCEIEGFHIPKKSTIIVNLYAIGRDPDAWPDAETFSPERFIGSDVDLRGHHFHLIPFGAGRRGCPGVQLALRVVRLVVAQLVHCFDWELPYGMSPEDLDMTEHFGLVNARVNHLMAIPTYRLRK